MASRKEIQTNLSHSPVDRPPLYHFFKIILSNTVEEKKLIPYKFVRSYGAELKDFADLIVPNGSVWKVGISKAQNSMWFDDGWQNFAEYHSICHGHFLVFGYTGVCSFNVFICDKTASEIEYPCNNEGPSYDEICQTRNEIEIPDGSPSKMLKSTTLSPPCCSSLKSKVSDASASKRDSSEPLTKLEQKHGMKRRGAASMLIPDSEQLDTRNKRLEVEQSVEIIGIHDDETKREKLGKHRVSELDEPLAIEQESSRIKCNSGEPKSLAEWEDKDIEISTSRRYKCVKVTPKSERAMAAARMYIPKNPSFMVLLRAYNSRRLYMPYRFSRHLKESPSCIKLQLSDGREWEVHIHRGGSNRRDIGVGWNTFCRDNNLNKGDVCVLELLNNKEVLKVSIFRAFEDGRNQN